MGERAGSYVGLDLGGTFLKGARVDEEGHILARIREPSQTHDTEALLAQLAAAVRTLAGSGDPAETVQGVGVGLPGIVDRASRVRVAPNVQVLNGVAVGDELRRRTGVPAAAENDANAAALAEAHRGAGRGAENVLMVALGTGVGAGVILNRRVWAGVSGYAGELGHVQVEPGGVRCGCGSWGCLETVVGIPGWGRRAQAQLDRGRPSVLRGAPLLDPRTIVDAARAGDELALELVEESARALSVGLAAALHLLNVERVVVGGGVSNAGPFLLDRVVEQVRRRTFPQVFADTTFKLAELGNDAGMIGAATLAMIELPHRIR